MVEGFLGTRTKPSEIGETVPFCCEDSAKLGQSPPVLFEFFINNELVVEERPGRPQRMAFSKPSTRRIAKRSARPTETATFLATLPKWVPLSLKPAVSSRKNP